MSLMYAQMGMAAFSAFNAHGQAKHEHRMEEIQRKYRRTMTDISAAQQLNTMTDNEVAMRDAFATAAFSIQTQSAIDRGAAEVGAAAAGVRGGSVKNAMRGIMRSKLLAQEALRKKLQAQNRANSNERRNFAMQRIMGRDVGVIPRPSAASALLGLGATMIDVYDSHQPEGQRTTDTIAGWGR